MKDVWPLIAMYALGFVMGSIFTLIVLVAIGGQ